MLSVGTVVDGKYKILSKIGQGGTSVIYLALNERANKTWAVKEIRKEGIQDFTAVKRGLIAEIDILKSLSHRYLPEIVDIIDGEENFLIVMDYIQGKPLNVILKERMERDGEPAAVEDVISWGIQLCDVLYYLHSRKNPVIYRDLKPANVMLKPDGEISLVDFGTARIFKTENSEDTMYLGTPGYAAPEQYGGNGQSRPQTDIYCLGATLHHLITGKNPAAAPFCFPKITVVRPALLGESSRKLRNTVLGLEMIIEKCTKYEPEKRYQNCAEIKYDLEHPEKLGLPYRKKLRTGCMVFVMTTVASLILGGCSFWASMMAEKIRTTGYDYYMERAATAAAEKMENYRRAVVLNPVREEAWLGILEAAEEDNQFSSEEEACIMALLNGRDNGRSRDNQACFRENRSGYVRFAYHLGLIYYYSEGSGGSKSSAAGWFSSVLSENLDLLDLGEEEKNKKAIKARAEILGKISSYHRKIGQVNQAGDAEVSYRDYWYDLMRLLDKNPAGEDNLITELRLCQEITYQIGTNYDRLKQDGLSQQEMEEALARVEKTVNFMHTDSSVALAEQIRKKVKEGIETARKQIAAVFVSEQKKEEKSDGYTGD